MTILIADDSEKGRELLRTYLEHLGYEVVEASNGREAVTLAEASGPEAMVLDVQMPVLDGYGAVRELREKPRFATTPILALTAYAMEEDRERALAAGFSAHLGKPLRLSHLREELARFLLGRSPAD
jgi:two-component system cell cycle response regulator DivK